MKKRILSILLTVAMLVAMVPAIAVSASAETGKVYEVSTPDDIYHFLYPTDNCNCPTGETCKYAGGNAKGNTVRLMADLDYSKYTKVTPATVYEGYWSTYYKTNNKTIAVRLLANVDGNGHTVYIPGGTYQYGAILCYFSAGIEYEFKNLKVEMASKDVVASHEEIISLFGDNTLIPEKVTFNNCFFNLNLKVTGYSNNSGAAVILARQSKAGSTMISVENCYFQMHASVANGRHGALLGRRYNEGSSALNFEIINSVFDVSYTRHMTQSDVEDKIKSDKESNQTNKNEYNIQCTTLVGDYRSATNTTVANTTTGNLYYNNTALSNETYSDNFKNAFTAATKGIDTITLSDAWTYTTTGSVIPKYWMNKVDRNHDTDDTVVTLKGYQTTDPNDNDKYNLRLVGVLDLVDGETTLASYQEVGFKVVANYGYSTDSNGTTKAIMKGSNKVYTSITANTATNQTEFTASALHEGANYIFALAIQNVPNTPVTFEVTPYYVTAEGDTFNGDTVVFTIQGAPSQNITE